MKRPVLERISEEERARLARALARLLADARRRRDLPQRESVR